MATVLQPSRSDRIRAALGVGLSHVVLGYALIVGLAVGMPGTLPDELKVFEIGPKPPPPPRERIVPRPKPSVKREGKASPPNLRAKATEIVAPPVIRPLPPPPIVAALKPNVGAAAYSGNADIRGPGTGSGGFGNGTGSGGYGDGDGDGGSPPRHIRGRLKDSDYPRGAGEAGVGGTVSVRYVVEADGHVSDCEIEQSSGNHLLDDTTCRLIQERFRFEPSRDERGRPVPSVLVENHEWVIHEEPPGR